MDQANIQKGQKIVIKKGEHAGDFIVEPVAEKPKRKPTRTRTPKPKVEKPKVEKPIKEKKVKLTRAEKKEKYAEINRSLMIAKQGYGMKREVKLFKPTTETNLDLLRQSGITLNSIEAEPASFDLYEFEKLIRQPSSYDDLIVCFIIFTIFLLFSLFLLLYFILFFFCFYCFFLYIIFEKINFITGR